MKYLHFIDNHVYQNQIVPHSINKDPSTITVDYLLRI